MGESFDEINELLRKIAGHDEGKPMTEQEWLTSDDPAYMLCWVTSQPADRAVRSNRLAHYVASDRKLRLFACAVMEPVVWVDRRIDGFSSLERELKVAYRMAEGEQLVSDLEIQSSSLFLCHRRASEAARFSLGMDGGKDRQAAILRDIIGNPFQRIFEGRLSDHKPDDNEIVGNLSAWLAWSDGTIPKLARQIYDSRDFTAMPILGDALEEAGCSDLDILEHCHNQYHISYRAMPKITHCRGCWVLDLVLGKE